MTKNRPASSLRGGPHRSVDRDGVVRVELRQGGLSMGRVALGLVVVGLLAGLIWRWRREQPALSAVNPVAAVAARGGSKDAPTLRVAARSAGTAALAKKPVAGVEALEEPLDPDSDDSLDEEATAGVEAKARAKTGALLGGREGETQGKTGIAAFPAPGTKKIKPGLKVPEDYALPPGYMRHYQTTDKGQMLEPILVYHPDYELVDAQGRVIPLPPDRVVPPERAPEGLPVDILQVPADAYADRDEHGPSPNVDPGQTGVEEEKPGDKAP